MKFKTKEATMLYDALKEEFENFVVKFNESMDKNSEELTIMDKLTLIGIRFQIEAEQTRQNLKMCLEFDAKVFERGDSDIQLEFYKVDKDSLN